MKNFQEYITVKKAASMLGVSIMTLHRWDAKGKLTPIRHPINGYRLYKTSDLQKVLHSINKHVGRIENQKKNCTNCISNKKRIRQINGRKQ